MTGGAGRTLFSSAGISNGNAHTPVPTHSYRDKWCKAHVNPNHRLALAGVNTEVCEEFFSWLVGLGKVLRHTSAKRFTAFCVIFVHLRNIKITEASAREAGEAAARPPKAQPKAQPKATAATVPSRVGPFAAVANEHVRQHGGPPTVNVAEALAFLGHDPELRAGLTAYMAARVPDKSSPAGREAYREGVRKALVAALARKTGADA